MPNEEPEGPNLPPEKEVRLNPFTDIKSGKYTELKGYIGAVVSVLVILSYLIYSYAYYKHGIKLNELYFIAQGIGIMTFTGLLFTLFNNVYVKVAFLFTAVFYFVLELIYIIVWICMGQPYAYIKQALIAGLFVGTIYFIYDKLTNRPINSN